MIIKLSLVMFLSFIFSSDVLIERAEISGKRVLSDFTQQTIAKLRK